MRQHTYRQFAEQVPNSDMSSGIYTRRKILLTVGFFIIRSAWFPAVSETLVFDSLKPQHHMRYCLKSVNNRRRDAFVLVTTIRVSDITHRQMAIHAVAENRVVRYAVRSGRRLPQSLSQHASDHQKVLRGTEPQPAPVAEATAAALAPSTRD